MPLDPPVMTATVPSSFPMTSPFRLRLWSFGEAPENLEMGPPASGVECGSAHIGGAKSNRLGDWCQRKRSDPAVQNRAMLVGVGYDDRPWHPHTECCSMCSIPASEGAPRGAG